MKMKLISSHSTKRRAISIAVICAILLGSFASLSARPVAKGKGSITPQRFVRQKNTFSNMEFYFTNKGNLFNNDAVAGLQWPRGTSNSYIFGGGVWFATQKIVGGKRRKLCELGYNPNSGAGWFSEGEVGADVSTRDSKYISYVGSRYNTNTGKYQGDENSTTVTKPLHNWPIWDTSSTKTLKQNYYFGDYISDVAMRDATKKNGNKEFKPALLSQEDIVNIYTDQDVSQNPEFRANTGYPFGLNIVEVIYSWSFGRYRDMIFIRHKITNASADTLYECYMAPAFDPDLGIGGSAAANDKNQYVGADTTADLKRTRKVLKGTCFENNPKRLNMAFQQSQAESGKQYGVIGFTFLESPATTGDNAGNIALDNSDYEAVGGYGLPDSKSQLGLTTFQKWTIQNDPPTGELRYDFVSDGSKTGDGGIVGDMRLLFATGKFTLPPQKSVETVIGIGIALASTQDVELNIDSVFKLIAFAHSVFGGDCYTKYDTVKTVDDTTFRSTISHFITPVPPDFPNISTVALDRAILVSWDNAADSSKDPLSTTLAFNQYDLYRTTRSDLDSTIRPDGINPIIHLGTWTRYDFKQDSVFDASKKFTGFKLTRKNAIANKVPHSFLDLGDDNKDGIISGNEGLYNGVKYFYFLTASDEFDSLNKVGPLTTSVVNGRNLVFGIPAKPVYPDLAPAVLDNSKCFSGNNQGASLKVGGIKDVSIAITDTGKYVELFKNDTVYVSFQPRWSEYTQKFLGQSPLDIDVDITDINQGIEYTYDKLNNPNATPAYTPYTFTSGLTQGVIGQNVDSNVTGKFTTDQSTFSPFQKIYQSFTVQADFEFTQLKEKYHINSIKGISTKGDMGIVRLSQRTLPERYKKGPIDYNNIPADATNPSFLGSLGEVTYEIVFGDPVDMNEVEYDTATNKTYTITNLNDQGSNIVYQPRPLPVTIRSITHCNQPLRVIRPGNRNDITVDGDYRSYSLFAPISPTQPGLSFPAYSDPDTLITPNPGWFAIDAYHYSDDDDVDHSAASFFTKTTGNYYYSHYNAPITAGGKFLATIHRLRLAGAEILFNRGGLVNEKALTGDSIAKDGNGQFANDFAPGDTIRVSFGGQSRGLPFPGAKFAVPTMPNGNINFANSGMYSAQNILDQVQVVPNPYIVTHIGQASTDAAKLYFTRLPPRATIQIYTLAGDLVKTIEHTGYADVVDANGVHSTDYNTLADRYNVEEWNLLSEGRQRVGSQVLIARVIAKDPKNGDAVIGETTTKFAVVLGGYRQVR